MGGGGEVRRDKRLCTCVLGFVPPIVNAPIDDAPIDGDVLAVALVLVLVEVTSRMRALVAVRGVCRYDSSTEAGSNCDGLGLTSDHTAAGCAVLAVLLCA
jgi:hypothetical protein